MRLAPVLAAATLLLAGCTTPAATAPSTATTTAAVTVTTAAQTSTPSTPTPSTTTTYSMGQTASTGTATFTLSERKVFTSGSRNVQAFMVKGCLASGQPVPFSYLRWTAYGPDGERYEPVDWSDIQPSYPAGVDDNEVVQPGDCVKGWIQFDTKGKLSRLKYLSGTGETFTYLLD